MTQCPVLPGDTFTYEFVVDRVRVHSCRLHMETYRPSYTSQLIISILFQLFSLPKNLQPGTYLYHAHYGMQREAGLYGSIRVSVPKGVSEPFSYDYDRSIILADWYHKSTYEQATDLSSDPFVWVGEPQVVKHTHISNQIFQKCFCT